MNVCAILHTLATILCFLLLNVEIADFFATGPGSDLRLHRQPRAGHDLFHRLVALRPRHAFVGMVRKIAAVRYAGIALLVVTLLKLFLHDLANLDQLYRIAASWAFPSFLSAPPTSTSASWEQRKKPTSHRPSRGFIDRRRIALFSATLPEFRRLISRSVRIQ
jgi:hypothetical protein